MKEEELLSEMQNTSITMEGWGGAVWVADVSLLDLKETMNMQNVNIICGLCGMSTRYVACMECSVTHKSILLVDESLLSSNVNHQSSIYIKYNH